MPSAKRVARSLEREELGEGHARWRSVVCCGHGDGSEGKDKHDGEAGDGEENGSRVRAEDVRSLFVVVVVMVCGGWWHSPT